VRLHVIYRSTDLENAKPRPAFFSKLLALQSFLRAREACPLEGELVFVNNGPIAAERLAVMHAAGRIDPQRGLELHESYWHALEVALGSGWAPGDLVYFAEDDYLYREDALGSLAAAARALPEAGYLAPYATVGVVMPNGEELHEGLRRPRHARSAPAWRIGPHEWRAATSHPSSFAVRLGVLEEDLPLHRLAPRCGGAWDHALCLAYQGRLPYGPPELVSPLRTPGFAPAHRPKVVARRLTLLAAAARRRRSGRLLVAPRPALATHLETAVMAAGTDWEELAAPGAAGPPAGGSARSPGISS
jgi:hypothetical protein